MTAKILGTVSAEPVKSFFVHMLTRDIGLHDAILDLLDNCVDGIQRSESKPRLEEDQPYHNYWARITLSEDEFKLEDNCGGIPWKLHEYAFRLGRVESNMHAGPRAIGTYGIGMKRAIFKMGEDCTITTHAEDESYRVRFSAEWMNDETEWKLDAERLEPAEQRGTTIVVRSLRDGIRQLFASTDFERNFRKTLSTYYAYIIRKGFLVYLNGEPVKPRHLRLLFADSEDKAFEEHRIEPFIYEADYKGVNVFLSIGFTGMIPSREDAEASIEDYKERYSSEDAGWTVVCNDRTVLYCDKTAMTGWGVSGVPQYHTQFVAISGIVVFTSKDPSKLPTTTTKRGIEPSSELYLQVKDKMIEGMKFFTRYTNTWKSKELVKISRAQFGKTTTAGLQKLRARASKIKMSNTRGLLEGRQHKPELPKPKSHKKEERIAFKKPIKQIRQVSKYLFDGDPDREPSEVGEGCFDLIRKEAEG